MIDLSALLTGDEGAISTRWHVVRDEYTLRTARGDEDFRSIDWKSSSRSPVLIARDYHRRQGGRIWVVLDLTSTMRFHTGEVSKLSVVSTIADALDRSAREQGALLWAITHAHLAPILPPTDRQNITPSVTSWCHALASRDITGSIQDIIHSLQGSWYLQKRDSFLLVSDDQYGLAEVLTSLRLPRRGLCVLDDSEANVLSSRVSLPLSVHGAVLWRFSRHSRERVSHPFMRVMIVWKDDPLAALSSLLSTHG